MLESCLMVLSVQKSYMIDKHIGLKYQYQWSMTCDYDIFYDGNKYCKKTIISMSWFLGGVSTKMYVYIYHYPNWIIEIGCWNLKE